MNLSTLCIYIELLTSPHISDFPTPIFCLPWLTWLTCISRLVYPELICWKSAQPALKRTRWSALACAVNWLVIRVKGAPRWKGVAGASSVSSIYLRSKLIDAHGTHTGELQRFSNAHANHGTVRPEIVRSKPTSPTQNQVKIVLPYLGLTLLRERHVFPVLPAHSAPAPSELPPRISRAPPWQWWWLLPPPGSALRSWATRQPPEKEHNEFYNSRANRRRPGFLA